jgi:flagellar biosynthesis chaperone FliJ
MDALAVMARLARQALDEERRALIRIDQAIGLTRDLLSEAHEAAERERRAACALADRNVRLLAYLRRMHDRAAALAAELRRLESARQAQAVRLSERHLEQRRLEILIERQAERARVEAAWNEQTAVDEPVQLRRWRRPGAEG